MRPIRTAQSGHFLKKTGVSQLVVVGALVLITPVSILVSRSIAWRHDYAEAESLVALVWPMAVEMQRFSTETGGLPGSLEELSRFSKRYDFSTLAPYHPKFTPGGESLLHLEANSRFSFEIDKTFTPKWARTMGVLETPK